MPGRAGIRRHTRLTRPSAPGGALPVRHPAVAAVCTPAAVQHAHLHALSGARRRAARRCRVQGAGVRRGPGDWGAATGRAVRAGCRASPGHHTSPRPTPPAHRTSGGRGPSRPGRTCSNGSGTCTRTSRRRRCVRGRALRDTEPGGGESGFALRRTSTRRSPGSARAIRAACTRTQPTSCHRALQIPPSDFLDQCYLVTHVIFTLNNWCAERRDLAVVVDSGGRAARCGS